MAEERSFFFRTEDRPLYGRLYSPDGEDCGTDGDVDVSLEAGMDHTANSDVSSAGRRGLVICDSLFEEKFWCERVVSNLARRLAAAGWTVLTFDIYGYGNSGGDSADVSLTSIYDDIGAACDLIRGKGVDSVSLLGLRWGALPACEVAARREDVDSIFLVNPVREWKKQFMKALRANVAGQYAIFKKVVMTREKIIEELLSGGDCVRSGYRMNNIDGYLISREFFEEVSDAVFPDVLPGNISKAAVITIPEKQASAEASADPLAEAWNSAGSDCEDIFIADDNAFWINNRIFTSDTPRFFAVMERLVGSVNDIPAGTCDQMPTIAESSSCIIDGVREEAVTVDSPDGHKLCGVTYVPEGGSDSAEGGSRKLDDDLRISKGDARNEGFVFTHGGLIGMNGAFRFNTRAARRLARAGYPAICCDTHGMGRSGGTIENQEQRVLFREICAGLFAGDVHSAAMYLKEKASVEKVALFGVCGGAITNILSHSNYEDIDESILLSVPVMLPGLDYGAVRMSEGFARFYLGLYLRKIFNPVAWYRFITGKSETDKIGKSAKVALGGMIRKLSGGGRKTSAAATGAAAKKEVRGGLSVTVPGVGDLQFNRGFLDAYRRITGRGGRVYFIFGEHDNFKYEFNSEFVDAMPEEYRAGMDTVTVEEITHANHMYTLREWQDIIIDKCMTWIAPG